VSQRKPVYHTNQKVAPFPGQSRLPTTISIAHYNELISLWLAALDENERLKAENTLLRHQLAKGKEDAAGYTDNRYR
jgi:hypothetical protein